ncbi:hypothetical protein C0J52_03132 [Blattella germanica]|nr:hypothetical protein C0J52_03132 [Blattella germanica]
MATCSSDLIWFVLLLFLTSVHLLISMLKKYLYILANELGNGGAYLLELYPLVG